jgi:hypothetical protein
LKIRIATTENEARFHHYREVVESPDFEWCGTLHPPFTDEKLSGIDAFICSCEHHWPTRLAIAACKKQGIPTFHVIDGIVEWRNLFENPRTSEKANGAPLFQPLISDHTFAMGWVQQWVLQWLGNSAVHATGLPRLDGIVAAPCRFGTPAGPPRLLIATANTPWFTEAQEQQFGREFERLIAGIPGAVPQVQCTWRVASPVVEKFKLPHALAEGAAQALAATDALVTTPSSLAIEAMLLGVPTLIFDPYACPVLTPSAWAATSADSVLQLLPSLLAPDAKRASLQDSLRDLIAPTDGKAAERIRESVLGVVNEKRIPYDPVLPSGQVVHPPNRSEHPDPSDWISNLSLSEMQGLVASIPALDRIIHEKEQHIDRLYQERTHPTFRHALGCLYRSLNRFRR